MDGPIGSGGSYEDNLILFLFLYLNMGMNESSEVHCHHYTSQLVSTRISRATYLSRSASRAPRRPVGILQAEVYHLACSVSPCFLAPPTYLSPSPRPSWRVRCLKVTILVRLWTRSDSFKVISTTVRQEVHRSTRSTPTQAPKKKPHSLARLSRSSKASDNSSRPSPPVRIYLSLP